MATSELTGCVVESWNIPTKNQYPRQLERKVHNFSFWVTPWDRIDATAAFYSDCSKTHSVELSIVEDNSKSFSNITVKICDLGVRTTAQLDCYHALQVAKYYSWLPSTFEKFDIIRRKFETSVNKPEFISLDTITSLDVKLTFIYEAKKIARYGGDGQRIPIPKTFEASCFETLDDLKSMLNDTSTADLKIKVTLGHEKTFHCHKVILKARSQVFRAMLESPMKERAENIIVVDDIRAKTMENFLSFLYCGRFPGDSWTKCLPSLTYAAEKYYVSSLKQFCDLNLIKGVTCENAIVIADFAVRHQLGTAIRQIRSFIERNAGYLTLDLEKATEALEVRDDE